jgi:folylpolyglutamate synthase/dihydropteroate synthase
MSNSFRKGEVPLGFGMALARNIEALNRFALMTEAERRSVIDGAHNVRSRGEMRDYVNNIPQM